MRAEQIPLGPEPAMNAARRGELRFHDARLCFQQWQSCASCHPDGRTDAMNWDLLNDGVGNPKQTRSMLLSHETPPVMSLGVRDTAEAAVRAGIRFIQFAEVDEQDARAIDTYLKSLAPVPSPRLVGGQLSDRAKLGQAVYHRLDCQSCHSGPHHTDGQAYEVPYADGMDQGRGFDTPTLIEVWRTAPYLYDGRAATMEEALRLHIDEVNGLDPAEVEALVEFVLSL
jgi:cytochrome c peroxidase